MAEFLAEPAPGAAPPEAVAYVNRTVLGLGCSTEGDILGLSPNQSDDPANWSHR